jgi:hypothetical protein
LMAGAASLLVDANLLVAFGTAPKSTALDSFLSRPQGHGTNSYVFLGHARLKLVRQTVQANWHDS